MQIEVGKFYQCRNGRKVKCRNAGSEWHGPDSFMMKDVESGSNFSVLPNGLELSGCIGDTDIIAEWTEDAPADEIEWGEWVDHITGDQLIGDWQSQSVGGVQQFRFPVKREPVVGMVTLYGYVQHPGNGAQFDDCWKESDHVTHRITLTIIDGIVQPTATVEAI